jgi:hypothetical protein
VRELEDYAASCLAWAAAALLLASLPGVPAKYAWLVAWYLGLDGSEIVGSDEFIVNVLDPLEEMVGALLVEGDE